MSDETPSPDSRGETHFGFRTVPEAEKAGMVHEVFSSVASNRCQSILQKLATGQPSQVKFNLSGQGRNLNFVRQGASGRLSIIIAGK